MRCRRSDREPFLFRKWAGGSHAHADAHAGVFNADDAGSDACADAYADAHAGVFNADDAGSDAYADAHAYAAESDAYADAHADAYAYAAEDYSDADADARLGPAYAAAESRNRAVTESRNRAVTEPRNRAVTDQAAVDRPADADRSWARRQRRHRRSAVKTVSWHIRLERI